MRLLSKYVVVTRSGNWLHMCDSYDEALHIAQRHNCRVERWTYPVDVDGTHGTPWKASVWQQEGGEA